VVPRNTQVNFIADSQHQSGSPRPLSISATISVRVLGGFHLSVVAVDRDVTFIPT